MILAPEKSSRLSKAELSQPCSTAIQIALIDLLRHYRVHPDVVVGHSSGEIAAAYAARAISASDAIKLAYYRGLVMASVDPEAGGMAAVGLSAHQVTPFLQKGVTVGCENSPASTTITGDKDALEQSMKAIKDAYPDTLVRLLHVDRAYHSCELDYSQFSIGSMGREL